MATTITVGFVNMAAAMARPDPTWAVGEPRIQSQTLRMPKNRAEDSSRAVR